jgi:putative nucleotidyltransferase with HDIG domain
MSNIFDQDYIEVNLTIFQQMHGPLPFDIFLKRAEGAYTKVFKHGDQIDFHRIKKYVEDKGVTRFYVKKENYSHYLMMVAKISNVYFEKAKDRPTEEVISVVKDVADLAMLELIENKVVDQRSVSYATNLIKGCLSTMSKDHISLVKMLKMISNHPYSFRHALTTTVFSLLLARAAKITGQRNLEILGMGALLHDIGMSMISFNAEEKSELSPEEWKEIKSHPEIGKRIVESVRNLPTESKLIILQHHEQPNGNGYPNNLYGRDIYYLAKFVSIADTFTALILPRPYRSHVYDPHEALEVMWYDRGKFDQTLVETFTTIFMMTKPNKAAHPKKKAG